MNKIVEVSLDSLKESIFGGESMSLIVHALLFQVYLFLIIRHILLTIKLQIHIQQPQPCSLELKRILEPLVLTEILLKVMLTPFMLQMRWNPLCFMRNVQEKIQVDCHVLQKFDKMTFALK